MKTKQKSRLAILLAALIASSALASCGDSGTPAVTTSATDNTKADTTTEAETGPVYKKPDKDFSGRNLNILIWTDSRFPIEEETGDVINDAIHKRDVKVSERLGVTFEFIALDDRNEVASRVQKTVLADDPAYEMAITAMSQGINTMISAGVLLDLGDLPYVTLDGGLWDRSIHDRMTFGGRQYFTTGVISAQFSQSPVACLFNKRLAGEYGIDDVYQTVLDGKWTIDLLSEYMKRSSHDLDGNGTMDVNDFYGFSLDPVFGNVLYASAGYDPITEKDGVFSVDLSDARMTEIIEKCAGIFGNPDVTYHNKFSDGSSLLVFRESRSIFTTCDMLDVQKFRDMADDFGIIPTPKFDESQVSYYTRAATGTTVFAVAATADTEIAAAVLEAMGSESYRTVIPTYYEVALKVKYTSDDKSAQVLDMIKANVKVDFASVFAAALSGPTDRFRENIAANNPDWISTCAGIKDKTLTLLDDVLKVYE